MIGNNNEESEMNPEFAALLTVLEAAAPRPSVEFQERLYSQVLAVRAPHQGLLWRLQQPLSNFGEFLQLTTNGDFDMRKGSVVLIGVIVLAAILVTAAVPAARAEVIETLRRITLGDSTDVQQIELLSEELPPGEYPWQMPEGTYWIVMTDVGAYGGNVMPGEDYEVKSVQTLEAAEALAGVRPLASTDLPDGYSLREVKVAPGSRPIFFQFYAGPGPDIVIVQTGVGTIAGESPGAAEAAVVSTVTDGRIEEVSFDGRPAAWIDGHLLKWEADGITYDIGGLGLDLATAMAIGRSLR